MQFPAGFLALARLATALFLAVPLSGLLWAEACGPSVQSVYEGNTRFEHCYRLDFDVRITPSHREACWRSWLGSYTYGQTRDRIEYAKRRIRSLENGDPARPRLNLQLDGGGARATESSPAPTSVHAPPPPTAQVAPADAAPADAGPEADAPGPPGTECLDVCRGEWKGCISACKADAGRGHKAACRACDKDYRRCVQRCFK